MLPRQVLAKPLGLQYLNRRSELQDEPLQLTHTLDREFDLRTSRSPAHLLARVPAALGDPAGDLAIEEQADAVFSLRQMRKAPRR